MIDPGRPLAWYTVRIGSASYPAVFPDSPRGRELVAEWIIELLAVLGPDPIYQGVTVTRQP